MTPQDVLFIGGDPQRNASAGIRAVEITKKLGCDCTLGTPWLPAIPDKYSAFLCVKPSLWPGQLAELAKRGKIIWDVIDELPPREHVAVYLASSTFARDLLEEYGRVEMIPHRHRNFSGEPNPPNGRRPGWIGCERWHPALPEVEHDAYFTERMTPEALEEALRKTGIGLNFRQPGPQHDFHAALNSGIKLINCLGFGIPSVSADEPAYHEFGTGCTIFAPLEDCAKWVRELQNDDGLYNALRQKCIEHAPRFHVNAIAEEYRKLFATL